MFSTHSILPAVAVLLAGFQLGSSMYTLDFQQNHSGNAPGWREIAIVYDSFTGCYKLSRKANAFVKTSFGGEEANIQRELMFYANNDCSGAETNIVSYATVFSNGWVDFSAPTGSFTVSLLYSKDRRRSNAGGPPKIENSLWTGSNKTSDNAIITTTPKELDARGPDASGPQGAFDLLHNADVISAIIAYQVVAYWQYQQLTHISTGNGPPFPSNYGDGNAVASEWGDQIEYDWGQGMGVNSWGQLEGGHPARTAIYRFYPERGFTSADISPAVARTSAM